MNFDYAYCRDLFLVGIAEALKAREEYILNIDSEARNSEDKDEDGNLRFSKIDGLSLDIYPWFNRSQLSILVDNDTIRDNPADWKHFAFIDTVEGNYPTLTEASSYASQAWESAEKFGFEYASIANLIFLAGAEAFTDDLITKIIESYKIDPCISYSPLESGSIERYVWDSDETIKANYCDIIFAQKACAAAMEKLNKG